jgi:hypothetical protein
MKIFLCLISFIFYYSLVECAQPYFPSEIVFSVNNDQTLYAIDEINQQAYTMIKYGSTGQETSFAMQHFPYAIPNSPESKYYVQLLIDSPPVGCMYGTYWKYGGNQFNSFPSHWLNGTSFQIKNYINFKYQMIHSTNSSVDEDHWYSNVKCQIDGGEEFPCEQIYFKKNTDIPLRLVQVLRRGWNVIQVTTSYQIISMGKSEEKYFDSIPKNWSLICRDVMLGLLYYPQTSKIDLNQSVKVQIWLPTPPHRINGNDTVIIQWNPTQCKDCFTISPKELTFNIDNFQERQTLTITRVNNGQKTTLIPNFNGGGFGPVPTQIYPIFIE